MTKFMKGFFASPLFRTKMYLTDDDTVSVTVGARVCPFRLRVWRGKDVPPLVLTSQIEGGPPTLWASRALANIALRRYIGYGEHGFHYAESFHRDGLTRLKSYTLALAGNVNRPYVESVAGVEVDKGTLTDMVGELVAL